MATCMRLGVRLGGAALTVLKPVSRRCSRQMTSVRSSLYEHVREGYSDKPELDMRTVCEQTDKVVANVENRKGDLRADDVRSIVSVTQSFILSVEMRFLTFVVAALLI